MSEREEIRTRQLERLRALIAAICETNSFYAPRLRTADLVDTVESLEAFAHRMPCTRKDEFVADQIASPPYGTNLSEPLDHYVRLHQTSSTSGKRPLRWLDTPESWSWMTDSWVEVLRAAEVSARDRVLCTFGFGPFIGFWIGFEAAQRLGAMAIAGGGMSTIQRLRVLEQHGVTVVCATPTYAIRLGETARADGAETTSVRALIVAGEPGGSLPRSRARLGELWPTATVFDHYGMTEVGPVTYQCSARPDAVHVHEPSYFAEIVERKSGMSLPLESGAAGELVLTTLGRSAAPALRYRTGDLVEVDGCDRCACGRSTLRLAGGIAGRVDDMVVVRGVNLYPSAVDEVVRGVGGVAEYRVEVDESAALVEVRMTAEPEAETDPSALGLALEGAFRDMWSLRIPVSVVARDTLPRFELKARRWTRV